MIDGCGRLPRINGDGYDCLKVAHMAEDFTRTDVDFVSSGTRCAAWLYRPRGVARPPVVIMAHGFGAERTFGLPAFAERFAAAGLATLLFDYRGFGQSDGQPRNLVSPRRHVQDWKAAIAAARRLPEVDTDRIALWGTSYSGGHVIVAASEDPAIRGHRLPGSVRRPDRHGAKAGGGLRIAGTGGRAARLAPRSHLPPAILCSGLWRARDARLPGHGRRGGGIWRDGAAGLDLAECLPCPVLGVDHVLSAAVGCRAGALPGAGDPGRERHALPRGRGPQDGPTDAGRNASGPARGALFGLPGYDLRDCRGR